MEKWVMAAKRADYAAIGQRLGIDPVVARVLRNRGVESDEEIRRYLWGGLEELHDPMLFLGMEKAVSMIKEKIALRKKIRIIGDYDIDGIMSVYILYQGLSELGAVVDYAIPNRILDGYGLNESLVRLAADSGADMILTCDNGISSGKSIRLAKELGLEVIVTDHHEVLEMPEAADAVIDAKREGETYPYRELCGAGVAFKLIRALGGDPEMRLLQYVAFATIGDVVDLTGENRIFVKEGLKALRKTDNAGLLALAKECRIEMQNVGTYHVGFILGPCLNASGRLDTALKALQLLLAQDSVMASRLAKELWQLNEERKAMTESGFKDAVENVERSQPIDTVLVVYLPALHESLCGLVAGRLRERYGRPCFVLTKVEGGVKGSGRSIEAYSMFEKLCEVKALLTKFGGHPMAAGLSMPEENVEVFRTELNEKAGLAEEDLVPKIVIDVPMPVSYITEELVDQLSLLEPFGKANPRPVFADRQVSLAHPRIFGANRNVLKTRVRSLAVPGDSREDLIGFQPAEVGPAFEAVAFRNVEALAEKIANDHWAQIAYYPKFNEYMGRRRIELEIQNFR